MGEDSDLEELISLGPAVRAAPRAPPNAEQQKRMLRAAERKLIESQRTEYARIAAKLEGVRTHRAGKTRQHYIRVPNDAPRPR